MELCFSYRCGLLTHELSFQEAQRPATDSSVCTLGKPRVGAVYLFLPKVSSHFYANLVKEGWHTKRNTDLQKTRVLVFIVSEEKTVGKAATIIQ